MLYLTVILVANLLIALLNSLFAFSALRYFGALGMTLLYTVAVIAVDGVFAFLIRRLPERWFRPENPSFAVSPRERRIYSALGIKRWKDLIPELGVFTGFHKDRLESTSDTAYLCRFLLESNYGVLIHLANAVSGFLILLLPFASRVCIALPVACVNFVLSILPVMILRYHTPVLLRLYRRSLRKDAKVKRSDP